MSHRAPLLARYGHKVAPLAANIFELLIAILSLIAAVTFFISPDALANSSIGQVLHPWDYIWNVLYCAGASFVIWGLWREQIRIEAAGLSFLTSAIVIAAIAVAFARGPSAASAVATYTAASGACAVRMYYLFMLEHALQEVDDFMTEVQNGGQ